MIEKDINSQYILWSGQNQWKGFSTPKDKDSLIVQFFLSYFKKHTYKTENNLILLLYTSINIPLPILMIIMPLTISTIQSIAIDLIIHNFV